MDKKNILLGVPKDLLAEIEKYKEINKSKTRTKALLELIKKGLEK